MQPLQNLAAIIYTRKSTASDGRSTRDQKKECRAWCAHSGIPVERVFCDEGISASRYSSKARGAWEELKAHLRPGHILVVWESSRATRDMGEWVELVDLCAERDVPVAYNGRILDLTTGDDRFTGGLDALLSAKESDKISERVSRGIRGALEAGTPHSRPPFGYRRKPRELHGAPEWEIDPEDGPRLREAVKRILAGESRRSVLRWLKDTGRAPASASSFCRVLVNPQIAGMRVHKGEISGEGTWPAIITLEQHKRLVSESIDGTTTTGTQSKHLCSGIVKCGKCGKGVRFRSEKGRRPVYKCPDGHTTRLAERLEMDVQFAVEEALYARWKKGSTAPDDPDVVAAVERIEQLTDELKVWKDRAISGRIDFDVYEGRERAIKAEIATLKPRTVPAQQPNFLVRGQWARATLKQRRDTVRALLDVKLTANGGIDITPK
jgi:site-specific DNA recombinase